MLAAILSFAMLQPAPAYGLAGEAFVFGSWNQYTMDSFNAKLRDPLERFRWLETDPGVASGFGGGLEVNVRFGRAIQTGLGVGADMLTAAINKNLGLQPTLHGTVVEYEQFNLNALVLTLRYSGAIAPADWISFVWGVAAGVGGLTSRNNYAVADKMGVPTETAQIVAPRGNAYEIDAGPNFTLPGPRGVTLGIRVGYRQFVLGPSVVFRREFPDKDYSKTYTNTSLDYSGMFFRIVLGSGVCR